MPLSNLVRNNLTYDTSRTPSDGFGKPLIVSVHTLFAERFKTVSTRQELIDFGFSTSGSVIGMFDVLMGQAKRPRSVSIGRRAAAVAMVVRIDIAATTDGTFTVEVNGVDYDFAASSNTATQIKDGLLAAISAPGVTDATVDSDSLSLTADDAGLPFTYSVSHSSNANAITATETTASVGIYNDLQAIRAVDKSFYAILSDNRTTPMILESARWTAAERALNVAQSDDAGILDPEEDTDVASRLLALQRERTLLLYKSNDAHYLDAAICGLQLPKVPGTTNWAWKVVAGVEADEFSETEVEALKAKRCGWVEDMGGEPTHFLGATSKSGMWVDLVRGGDKVRNDVDGAVVDAMKGAEKIGFDELPIVEGVIEGAIRKNGGLVLADSIEVNLPTEISEEDVANRRLLGINWKATIRTPVNEVESDGELTISGVV